MRCRVGVLASVLQDASYASGAWVANEVNLKRWSGIGLSQYHIDAGRIDFVL